MEKRSENIFVTILIPLIYLLANPIDPHVALKVNVLVQGPIIEFLEEEKNVAFNGQIFVGFFVIVTKKLRSNHRLRRVLGFDNSYCMGLIGHLYIWY